MSFKPGIHLGPYEILAPLGAGGMGEVYKARDTRLDRLVAIKTLAPGWSTQADRRERFDREARVISSLNHPHICVLYDIGSHDGTEYLVMEYLEGETLSQRLLKGPLPPDQALRHGIEILDALDKAHHQGVIHRDLKPANIMLTGSGTKLLDFGLAKLRGSGTGTAGLSMLPTREGTLTAEGTILGTLQYMAPEQLEGMEADHRTDIFAFGAVLYEMVTGRKAFEGKGQASLISAIMTSDPPAMSTLQPLTPPVLDHLVKRCLAKNPDQRWQTARDLLQELKWAVETGIHVHFGAPASPVKARNFFAWTLIALLSLVAAALAWVHFSQRQQESVPMRVSIVPPEGVIAREVAISPDGRQLAFTGANAGNTLLWIRSLDAFTARPLQGTTGASQPFWSPDSRFIGFFADGRLKRIDSSGGPIQDLSSAPIPRGGSWGARGDILYIPASRGPILRIAAGGGSPTRITAVDESRREINHRWPYFLPDNRRFLYLSYPYESERREIRLGSLDSKETRTLIKNAGRARYSPPGYLLFERQGILMAQRFDLNDSQVKGEPVPLAEGVGNYAATGDANFSVSDDGIIAYSSADPAARMKQLTWFDRSGKVQGFLGTPGANYHVSISPDQKRVAVDREDPERGDDDIWVIETSRGVASRLTFEPGFYDRSPVWSPDGNQIAFSSSGEDFSVRLLQKNSSGAGTHAVLLSAKDYFVQPQDWSPDGRYIVYARVTLDARAAADLWVIPLFGDRKPWPLVQTPFREAHAHVSPDGRWIAYSSDESSKLEVYVQSFPSGAGKWLISSGGGMQPRWRGDGKEIFYIAPDGTLMAVKIKTSGSRIEVGLPETLFKVRARFDRFLMMTYDVDRKGERFLVNNPIEEQKGSPINLILNWRAEVPE